MTGAFAGSKSATLVPMTQYQYNIFESHLTTKIIDRNNYGYSYTYDPVGNLRDWWTPASAKAYTERSKAIVAQYAAYEPLPGLHINGELTQGENIADNGGLKIAYAAFQKALAKHPEEANKKIDGFTPDQRFFLAWAQIWRANQRDEDLKLRVNTDPHSPGEFRCNGPLSNMPEFQKAFNLPDDSKMVRKDRTAIW